MTGGKVILTYKRQRPPHWIAYKRKRLPSRKDFSEDNECCDTSVDCPSCNVSSIEDKQEESPEGNKPECPMKDFERAPEGKRQFSGCIQQQDCLVSTEVSRGEDQNLFLCDIRPLIADSHAVSEGSPREDTSQKPSGDQITQKPSGDQLSTDLHNLVKSNSIQEASCSNVDSVSACDDKSTATCSGPLSANCNSGTEPQPVSIKSSVGENYKNDGIIAGASEKISLKETGLPVEDKFSSLSINASTQSKLSSPIITFYRRCKRKKDVDGLNRQNTLVVKEDCALAVEGSKSLGFTSAGEATPHKSGSEYSLLNTNLPEKYLYRRSSVDAYHEKIASREDEYSCVSRLSPETENNVKQADDKLENTLKDNPSSVENTSKYNPSSVEVPHNSVGVDFQEGPISCSGNLSNDTADGPSHERVLFNCHATVGKGSQSLSNDGLNTVRMTNEVPSSRAYIVSLDLSIPPPDSHDVEDCNTSSVHGEQTLHGSVDLHGGSHYALFNSESSINRGSEMRNEKIGERHSCHQAQVLENGCISEEAVGHTYNNNVANSSPKNNYLQLFPEDRTDDMFQSTKMYQNVTTGADSEERTLDLLESRNQTRSAATKSSLFLGLVLPMEVINDGNDRSSTSSRSPNVGVQSKEFLQNTVTSFPDQASSYVRHKIVLDNIVSRARTLKRKRGSCLDLDVSTRMWSEEELDCLWVGVRRYGRGNWVVMLRDPRLHFSPWRTPRDLAEQWEEEQSKLFNTMPFSLGRHLRTPNIFRDSVDGFRHSKTGKHNLAGDVQLSLGDVYSQPKDNVQKMSLFNFMDHQSNAPRQLQKPITNARTLYSCRRAMFQNNTTLDVECSFSANNSTCIAGEGNLPHWLREVVTMPLRPPQPTLPSDTSSVPDVEMQWVKKPCFKGIHRDPRNRISNRQTVSYRGEQHAGGGAHNKTEQGRYPGNKQELIIIDSDASSEETISDDRSAKL